MPFEIKGEEALTERIGVRVTAGEKVQLKEDADDAGLSVSELVRRRYFGRKIVARSDEKMIRHLNRIGGRSSTSTTSRAASTPLKRRGHLGRSMRTSTSWPTKGPTDDHQEDSSRSGQGRAQVQGDQHR